MSPSRHLPGPIARRKGAYWKWLRATDLETLHAIGDSLHGHDKKKDSPRICPVCKLLKYGKWGGAWHLHKNGKYYSFEEKE
jgi:hypothetical protein